MIIRLTPDDMRGMAALGITITVETEAEHVSWTWPDTTPEEHDLA